jgi:hypothetical protein
MIRRCIRAQATLLLAVFLAAGSSLPSLDALFYHAGSCTLARTAPGSGAVILSDAQPQLIALTPPPPTQLVTQYQPSTHRTTLARPRAPPASVS